MSLHSAATKLWARKCDLHKYGFYQKLIFENSQHIEVRECLLSFSAECFVFQFAIQKYED